MDKQQITSFLDKLNSNTLVDDPHEAIKQLLIEWGTVKYQLETLYKNRDQKNTLEGMEKGISLFIQFLYWSNDRQILGKESIPVVDLEIKPVNVEERLKFIISRPNLFHSYRQLGELMIEQQKLYAKKIVLKKASKPRS
jgi:hypothetical protein